MCGSLSVGFVASCFQFTLRTTQFKLFRIRPISSSVDTFLENAQQIFDVARADSSGESSDFTLLVRPDGSLHMIMEATVNPESVALEYGAGTAYRVSRCRGSVTVSGSRGTERCSLTSGRPPRPLTGLLRDQPLYLLAGPGLSAYPSSVPLRIASPG